MGSPRNWGYMLTWLTIGMCIATPVPHGDDFWELCLPQNWQLAPVAQIAARLSVVPLVTGKLASAPQSLHITPVHPARPRTCFWPPGCLLETLTLWLDMPHGVQHDISTSRLFGVVLAASKRFIFILERAPDTIGQSSSCRLSYWGCFLPTGFGGCSLVCASGQWPAVGGMMAWGWSQGSKGLGFGRYSSVSLDSDP